MRTAYGFNWGGEVYQIKDIDALIWLAIGLYIWGTVSVFIEAASRKDAPWSYVLFISIIWPFMLGAVMVRKLRG